MQTSEINSEFSFNSDFIILKSALSINSDFIILKSELL